LKVANLKMNHDKASLIAINSPDQEIIQTSTEPIIGTDKHEPVRFLGTWVTKSGSKLYQKKLIREKTEYTTSILRRKQITDKQCKYILNHVLTPAIEYLLQDTILSTSECNKINSKIRTTSKRKVGIASTGINSGIALFTGYKLFHIDDRQLQLHTRLFFKNINQEGTCGFCTRGRLQHLQKNEWTRKSILDPNYNTKSCANRNLTNKILTLLKSEDITILPTMNRKLITTHDNNRLHPIESYVPEQWYKHHRKQLKKHNLFYIEQITNLSQTRIISWTQFKANQNSKYIGRHPKWYTHLVNTIAEPNLKDNCWSITIPNLSYTSIRHWIIPSSRKETSILR